MVDAQQDHTKKNSIAVARLGAAERGADGRRSNHPAERNGKGKGQLMEKPKKPTGRELLVLRPKIRNVVHP